MYFLGCQIGLIMVIIMMPIQQLGGTLLYRFKTSCSFPSATVCKGEQRLGASRRHNLFLRDWPNSLGRVSGKGIKRYVAFSLELTRIHRNIPPWALPVGQAKGL